MKKQNLIVGSLVLKKVSIALVTNIKGRDDDFVKNNDRPETYTCSVIPNCLTTVDTRPDSFNPFTTTPTDQEATDNGSN